MREAKNIPTYESDGPNIVLRNEPKVSEHEVDTDLNEIVCKVGPRTLSF